MTNGNDARWQQRLENFGKAMTHFEDACSLEKYSDLERSGLVQVFQFTFELAWKTLKDLLVFEGYPVKSPRETLRQGFDSGYLSEEDAESLLDALEKRNLLTHTYQEAIAHEAERLIRHRYANAIRQLYDSLHRKQAP